MAATSAPMAGVPMYIKRLTGRTNLFHMDGSATIHDVLIHIQDQEGIPPNQIQLVLGSLRTYGADSRIEMDVDVSDTIDEVVERLHDELGLEPAYQLLIFQQIVPVPRSEASPPRAAAAA